MKRLFSYCVAAALLIVAALLCCACQEVPVKPSAVSVPTSGEQLVVRYVDVGQGDCSLISCGDHHLLIDGGDHSNSQKLYAILKNLGITQLDAVIATHSDADHIGGIPGALNYADAKACYCSVTQADTKTFQSLVKYVERARCSIQVPSVGDSFMLGGAAVTFLGPVPGMEGDNNNSLVVRIDYGQTSFLFMGDAEVEAEEVLMRSGVALGADVLKVAHHGSRSSSSASFLKCVSPKIAVVSVGENTYGHPTDEVLSRLERLGTQVLRTDQLGTIYVESDGANLVTSHVEYVDH